MKICLVSPYDYPYPGGVTEHIKGLEKYLSLRGHEVMILAPSSEEDGALLAPNVRRAGSVVQLAANGSKARISLSLGTRRIIRRILADEAFDVIHLHEPLMPMLPLLVLRQSQTCNIGTFHAFGDESLAYATARPLLQGYHARLHGRIAVSEAAASYVSQYFPADYTIIPNGIDVARFAAPQPPLERYRDGRPTVLFVGRFEEARKGFATLLQAVPLMRSVFPDLRVVVAGKGDPELFSDLLAEAPGMVEFAGYVSAEELPRYYQSCDVYCAPSTGQESFGIVLLEAMAAGTAVVASRNPGYGAVMTHGQDGLLVEPRAPELLAVALARMLSDAPLRRAMIARGRETAARYDWPVVAARIEQFYEATRTRILAHAPAGSRLAGRRSRTISSWSGSIRGPLADEWEQNLDRATTRLGDLLGVAPNNGLWIWRRMGLPRRPEPRDPATGADVDLEAPGPRMR